MERGGNEILGELTSELGRDEWIIRFSLAGSKCYAFQTNLGCEVVHVKGFSLKKKKDTRNKFTFKSLETVIKDNQQMIAVMYTDFITCNKQMNVFTYDFDKQVVLNDFSTKPFGY